MWCKICKKNVRSISHWAKEHKKYLQEKRKSSRHVSSQIGRSKAAQITKNAKNETFGTSKKELIRALREIEKRIT
jgi:hypothetical protein